MDWNLKEVTDERCRNVAGGWGVHAELLEDKCAAACAAAVRRQGACHLALGRARARHATAR